MEQDLLAKADFTYVDAQDASMLSQAKAYADNGFLKVENPRIISTSDIYNKTEIDGKVNPIITQQSTNTNNIATNASNIAANTANIATNTADIATLKTSDATHTTQIATNTADIVTNKSDIATNTTAIGATTTPTSILGRVDALEKALAGGGSLVTASIKYASDIGQPQMAGGTTTKATFDLANLLNDNSGTQPKFTFSDESLFDIKVRYTIDGQNQPYNLLFTINVGDAEPTIIAFNDRTGANANAGVVARAKLGTDGKLEIETINVDGTTPTFSVINYSTMVVTQIQEFTISLASNLVT
ncbi:UNVERIFIED_CONTAM: hypothetical protein RF648_17715, partial [Kocuria sp. CPCC 205274]